MIIQSLNHCYEIMRQLISTDRMAEFFCREQQSQETFLLVKIADITLAKRFTLFLEEKVRGTEFPDYKDCFQEDEVFYIVFTYSPGRTLADKLGMESHTGKERGEIARRLLEQLLLRNPHPYFMRNALKPDVITVTDSLDVSWNYHLDEEGDFDCCTMETVCRQLAEVMQLLFEEELDRKQYPQLENYLLALADGRMSDYLELYRGFMPVYEALCVEGEIHQPQTYLQRLWDGCRKIINKPDSLRGYLRLGERYVAKKLALVLVLFIIILPLSFIWLVYPWVQSRFLTKTMVIYSKDMEGYTGRVRLVEDLEAGNVIFTGTLTEGRINGQGTLYDSEGNLLYRGEFLADQYSGVGESYYKNGNMEYAGQFGANQYEGAGKLYDETGSLIYEGGFAQGLYQGSGLLYYPGGRLQYRGNFSQGLYDGAGVLFYENGVASYEGEFFQGKKSGSGRAYDKSGELVYDGAFSQDRYEGEGTLYRAGQAVGQGSFHLGILTSGAAVCYDRQGNLTYEGGIKNGFHDGEGKMFSGDILIYEGGFAEGNYHGNGREYHEATGALVYDGMYEQGKYSGEGRLYDGETGGLLYEGGFYQGIYDGEGKLYDPVEGYLVYEGGFREGQYDGQGRSYDAGILVYEGEFLLGTYNGRGILYDLTTGIAAYEGVFYNGQPLTEPACPEQED